MHEASRSMLKLIENVLDISKIEAGKVTVEETDFDLHGLIKARRVLVSQAEIRGLQLRAHVMPEVPHCVAGDPYHLRQVLYKRHRNGISLQVRRGDLTVSSHREGDQAVRLRFAIEDTGIGMHRVQERIFRKLRAGDDSTTRVRKGPASHHDCEAARLK